MWGAERIGAGVARASTPDPAPAELSVGAPGVEIVNVTTQVRERLRGEASELGGRSALLQYIDAPDAGIDITNAHPGGLPQFITGQATALSGLFRDEVALLAARRAAESITAKNVELRAVRGVDAVRLGVGLASWRIGGLDFCAPVLLRPLAIRRRGTDFELKLHGRFAVNPELVEAAREHFGIALDGPALSALAHDEGIFKPQRVIDRLRQLTAALPGFTVRPRLIVSTFADVGRAMGRDLGGDSHTVLDALTGHPAAREMLRQQPAEVRGANADERAPAADTLLLDADDEQEHVLAQIAAGRSVAIATLPGTGGTQTVINAIGSLVQEGKRVLVVSSRRSSLDSVRQRLAHVGLAGLGVTVHDAVRDLVRSIGRNERATAPQLSEVDDALVRLRSLLLNYRVALTERDPHLQVSPVDALRALAALLDGPGSPSTTARFDVSTTRALAVARADAAHKLVASAELGAFRFGPGDSPWYGAQFGGSEEVARAHALAGKLHSRDVPQLLERGYELIAKTRMRPFASIEELGECLRLLAEIGDSLDRFVPAAFSAPLTEVIRAIGPRKDSEGMRASDRSRLRRLAREYVRPGVHVADLHEGLVRIQRQRQQWQRFVDAGVVPEVPAGIADVQVACQRVVADLAELDRPLGRSHDRRLAALPIDRLVRMLAGLAAESDILHNLIERTALRTELTAAGLDPLLTELTSRRVPAERVADELEFAWWQSALEHLLRGDKRLLGANTAVVDRLERDFRLVDEAHAASAGPALAWRLAREWQIALVDEPAEAAAIKPLLRRADSTPRAMVDAAPTLVRALAPVWLASPYDVPQLPEALEFDAVVIMDGAAINLAEAAPALRRARQVVIVGDPVTQRPTPFCIAAGSAEPREPEFEPDEASVFERLADLLPVYTLTRSYRAGGEDLAGLVNDAFYGGEIVSWPWAGSYLGRGSLAVDYVEGGTGTPDPVSGAVESPDAEVSRVVTLVLEHALNRPRESLMVVTASRRHAERVRIAAAHALSGRADVAEFVDRSGGTSGAEPFVVLTLEESVAESRDRVIFSLGFGTTRHGRVLSDFGDLSTPDGERLLTVGMTRARRSMVIVSSIRPEAVEDRTLEHGAGTMMSVLGGIAAREQIVHGASVDDPLLVPLVAQLHALGVRVDADYRGLGLVARHGGVAVVIEADRAASDDASLREAVRLRPQLLRRLGWHYARVHAFDLYTDPVRVASKIAGILGIEVDEPADPGLEATQPVA